MCGITGHFSKTKKINKHECMQMSDAIKHRGPDDFGNHFETNIYIGHRRLSIIDPTKKGHQPMWDKQKKIAIVFNGEIYNYKEIKNQLSDYYFNSNSDTEVIIYAYKKWGLKKTIAKLNGMFAFCIYDKEKKQAFFTRDRIGIKPFVYYADNENFIFASELKALLKNSVIKKQLNKKSVANYFIHRYVPNPDTIFKNINKLEPGHYIKLNLKTFELKKTQYWKLNNNRYLYLSEKEITKKAEILINDAVNFRLIADTEVASFLSGGIDSSLISSIAKKNNPKLNAFTISIQPKQYSEVKSAIIAAKHSDIKLTINKVDKSAFQNNFDNIIKYYDEPFADSSLVPTFLLTKFVAESGIKCALSGDGGDEVFFGYYWYNSFRKLEIINKFTKFLPVKLCNLFLKFSSNSFMQLAMLPVTKRYRKIIYNRFTLSEINSLFNYNLDFKEEELFTKKIKKNNIRLADLSFLDFQTFMIDDILYKVDIASMANSIEVRVPFLDHNLVEFMFSVPFKYLYRNKKLKYILKKISSKYLSNKNINRRKKGFSAPVMQWIHKNFEKELMEGSLIKNNMISQKKMQNFIKNEKNKGKIWQLYIFEKWYSNYFF